MDTVKFPTADGQTRRYRLGAMTRPQAARFLREARRRAGGYASHADQTIKDGRPGKFTMLLRVHATGEMVAVCVAPDGRLARPQA